MDLTDHITVWQQNVNKSRNCQHNLISNNDLINKGISFIALQEPTMDHNGYTLVLRDWTLVYPSTHQSSDNPSRTVMLVNASIRSDTWKQLKFPSSDVMVIQLSGRWGKLTIVNVYNNCNNDTTVWLLTEFHRKNHSELTELTNGTAHVLWVRDFNRHHPYWDNPSNIRLFTKDVLEVAEKLIKVVADTSLDLVLPSGIPTHKHNVIKLWSRLDQVFISDHSENLLISCDTQPDQRGINTDHLPIITELDLIADIIQEEDINNFHNVDWDKFCKELSIQLANLPQPTPIDSQEQLEHSCKSLMKAIQRVIVTQVLVTNITPKSKRWWMKELTQLHCQSNKLGRQLYDWRHDLGHAIHRAHVVASKQYQKLLDQTREHHWRDWLEKGEDPDIWSAHRLTSTPWGNGGKTRIPMLIHKVGEVEEQANTNQDKGRMLAKGFFPAKPPINNTLDEFSYLPECKSKGVITTKQIHVQLAAQKAKTIQSSGPRQYHEYCPYQKR